jgi:exonuclease SbcC
MMLVHSISVKNIRTYNDGNETRLDFPEGVTLLEGDIGSGKSTLLYAMEFALFGFSDMKGSHLLSEGRREGSVSISFESGGDVYTIDRGLKAKGDNVVQEDCFITTNGERTRLSPSDLKERVVSILGFNEPTHPTAESLVYRYAVFTPQEQMKEILVRKAEERLHVIRRVLGAQSYQVAAENSDLVEKGVKRLAYGLKKASEDIEEKKDEQDEMFRAVARLESELPGLEKAGTESAARVERLESEWKESIGLRRSLSKSEGRLPLLKREHSELTSSMETDQQRLQASEEELNGEVEPVIEAFEARKEPEHSARSIDAKLTSARGKLARLEAEKDSLENELAKSEELLAQGVCPLCGQRISGDFHAKTEHSEKELKKLVEEIPAAASSIESLSRNLDDAKDFEEEEKEYMRATKDRSRLEDEIRSLKEKLKKSNARLPQLAAELKEATSEVEALQGVSEKISKLEGRLAEAREAEKADSLALNQAKTELADSNRELRRLTEEVKKRQAAIDGARHLSSYEGWLSTFFGPTVEMIEKQTLSRAAARFNEHFQRFFTSLVDDPDMVVRVKEDFSPLFEREGFEQDFDALSGGERTSMALAYRFALNSVVRESVSTQPELVILDEPTDGFSKEQVYKMRGLLEQLNSRQVILVSHEKELESMADHIFRVEKRNGTSEITRVGP